MQDDNGQCRAKAGGEFGANGEWYAGGEFIATTDHAKGGRLAHQPSEEEKARWAAREAAYLAEKQRADAWLASRVAEFAPLLAALESEPRGVFPTFWQSLAQQLRSDGRLSEKQARYAVKAYFGRENKSNRDEYWVMLEKLSENFNG